MTNQISAKKPAKRGFSLLPRSLSGQLLLTVAVALFIAQAINAVLVYRGQLQQAQTQITSAAAIRLISAEQRLSDGRGLRPGRRFGRDRRFDSDQTAGERRNQGPDRGDRRYRRTALLDANPVDDDMLALPQIVADIKPMLAAYDIKPRQIVAALDPQPRPIDARGRLQIIGKNAPDNKRYDAIIAIQRDDGLWLTARVNAPVRGRQIGIMLIAQTILLYLILLIPIIWIARRIARPLADLQTGVAAFQSDQTATPITPKGPYDVAQLITAFNSMSARIAAMLDEKDVMLGAIGHDLKTPLAALRVRVESVGDDHARTRMVASIDDINRTLDDLLALARVGHINAGLQSAPEPVNMTALIEMIVEEYQDLGEQVVFADHARITMPVHITWIRRAIRNLVSNALRYGQRARIAMVATGDALKITIEDDGPGIPEDQIAHIFEPFTRLETSRNSATGGAGLGLTLARAIAEQHGGTLTLANRIGTDGDVQGLTAWLELPMARAT